MTDHEHGGTTDREQVIRTLDAHAAFERRGDRFDVTTTAFDAHVRLRESATGLALLATVRVPTLDAVVAGETVAPVVQEGWFETFERRLEDVGGATRTDPEEPTATLDETAREVVVRTSLDAEHPSVAIDDAKAVVDYVEGTFVEGMVPGYTYREPAAGLLERARTAAER